MIILVSASMTREMRQRMIDVFLTVALFAACIMGGVTFLGFVFTMFLVVRELTRRDKDDG